jgi:hypothetical protein
MPGSKPPAKNKRSFSQRGLLQLGIADKLVSGTEMRDARRFITQLKATFKTRPQLISHRVAREILGTSGTTLKKLANAGLITRVVLESGSRETVYYDRATLASELQSTRIKTHLLNEVKGKNPNAKKMREQLIEKFDENASLLLNK